MTRAKPWLLETQTHETVTDTPRTLLPRITMLLAAMPMSVTALLKETNTA